MHSSKMNSLEGSAADSATFEHEQRENVQMYGHHDADCAYSEENIDDDLMCNCTEPSDTYLEYLWKEDIKTIRSDCSNPVMSKYLTASAKRVVLDEYRKSEYFVTKLLPFINSFSHLLFAFLIFLFTLSSYFLQNICCSNC